MDLELSDKVVIITGELAGVGAVRRRLATEGAIPVIIVEIGPIQGLINNAGANDGAGLAAFRQSLDGNLLHYYLLAHLCEAQLKADRGALVNIAPETALAGQACGRLIIRGSIRQ